MSLIRLRRFGDHFVDPRHVIAVECTPYPSRGVRLSLSTGATLWAPVRMHALASAVEADKRVEQFLIDLGVPEIEVRPEEEDE